MLRPLATGNAALVATKLPPQFLQPILEQLGRVKDCPAGLRIGLVGPLPFKLPKADLTKTPRDEDQTMKKLRKGGL
jgi:hypothetical protein